MVPRIAAVNAELAQLAKEKRVTMADYASVLADGEGGLKDALGNDGLHPNRDGYAAMRPARRTRHRPRGEIGGDDANCSGVS